MNLLVVCFLELCCDSMISGLLVVVAFTFRCWLCWLFGLDLVVVYFVCSEFLWFVCLLYFVVVLIGCLLLFGCVWLFVVVWGCFAFD